MFIGTHIQNQRRMYLHTPGFDAVVVLGLVILVIVAGVVVVVLGLVILVIVAGVVVVVLGLVW